MRPLLTSLAQEHRALLAQYGEVQMRCSALIAAQAAEIRRLQAEAIRLRATVVVQGTALAWAREDRLALEAAIPGLPKRLTLAKRVESLITRVHELMRERLHWQRQTPAAALPRSSAAEQPADLREKSVLCVGDDGPGTPMAQLVALAGGHFLHHGGGEVDDSAALEASLVAADLVICQTGCVSHDAYWRVQDHCRRTGKQCVLVGQAQALQFVRHPAASPLPESAISEH